MQTIPLKEPEEGKCFSREKTEREMQKYDGLFGISAQTQEVYEIVSEQKRKGTVVALTISILERYLSKLRKV